MEILPRWIARPIGFHVLAAGVLLLAFIGGLIGLLVAGSAFDTLRPFDDNQTYTASLHPTTAGYIGEVLFAAIPSVAICLLMIPLLAGRAHPLHDWPRSASA